jgi:hypothetical protein
VFGVSVATQTYIFLNGTPSIFLRFWKALVKTKRKIPHLMGLTSTVGLSGHKRANSLLTVEVRPIKCGIFLFVLMRAFQKRKKILGVPFKKL